MAVQFKFRSSVNFESVAIDGRASISVRDLKSKIIRHKNLNLCQDSELVFSDAVTGQEYNDESIQIPCGSSVVIKRVPAGSVHVNQPHFNSCQNLHSKDSVDAKSPAAPNAKTVDFDDFGVDLYPIPKEIVFSSDLDTDKDNFIYDYQPNTDNGIKRYSEPAMRRCLKLEASSISDAFPGVHVHSGVEQIILPTKSKPEEEDMNVERVGSATALDTQHANLSSELKCSLCNAFFKEAVMIPCCQHSFCEKCISQVLREKTRCPKCLLTKCRVEDLLPNVSLRQAIEHFLESQNLITAPDNDCCQYAPDGESGIQAKDVSRGGNILQREAEAPHSPETGTGSNHLFAESAFNPPFQKDVKPAITKRRPPWVSSEGGDKSFSETGKHRKGERTCYRCGSPDHFIRDCPVASSPHPMLHAGNAIFPGAVPGYVPPYWNGAPSPHAMPFGNPYGNHARMAFGTNMVPPGPYAVPAYMPSMYNSFPSFGGYMRMGGVAPLPVTGEDWHLSRTESVDLHGRGKRRKVSNENLRREQSHDGEDDEDRDLNERHYYNGTEKIHDHRSRINREMSISYSEDGSTKGSQRQFRHHNHTDEDRLAVQGQQKSSRLVVDGQDQKQYHRTEGSSSELDDVPSSSGCHSEERQKHHHRSSRKHKDQREQCGSDSSQSHHRYTKDNNRNRIEHESKRHNQKYRSHSGYGIDQSGSSDKKLQKESSHSSRHSKLSGKSNVDERSHDRWKMVSGSDEDCGEGYPYSRQKRKH
ncbi:hypothetical protein ACFX13_016802 [Malus domestica]|uniref:E3 ubiquitin ligase PARAQUAT TOLERANCE 3-like n=1 Tax=Malus domestica TaxID=3750 RepID=UPI0004988B3E|nr:E3 ubiquitin ligase PARAQUAT TOLERANCE 3-like [Malus domestica]XP_008367632.1 E3 ubiquitin ligase PARAQUAT TOLERANCE 3-like [Malus domestica]